MSLGLSMLEWRITMEQSPRLNRNLHFQLAAVSQTSTTKPHTFCCKCKDLTPAPNCQKRPTFHMFNPVFGKIHSAFQYEGTLIFWTCKYGVQHIHTYILWKHIINSSSVLHMCSIACTPPLFSLPSRCFLPRAHTGGLVLGMVLPKSFTSPTPFHLLESQLRLTMWCLKRNELSWRT